MLRTKSPTKLSAQKAAAIFAVAFFILGAARAAKAQVLVIFPERQQERKSVRWSLADWMATKKTIAAQDAWLARHTNKFPVDLTLGADLRPGFAGLELDLFALSVGLHARYERGTSLLRSSSQPMSDRDQGGDFGLQLRLFGGNPQNTSLTLRGFYEYRHVNRSDVFNGAYGGYALGPELQIYLAPWLGVRAEWRYRFSAKRITARGADLAGNGWFAVAFLEMNSLRLEGGWNQRSWEFSDTSGNAAKLDDGGLVGRVRLFF